MTDITHIPLNKLIAWEGNARRTTSEDGIGELAASIQAHGLLQSLVVKRDGKKFAVVAGNRRLTALQRLAKAKAIKGDYSVPCHITEDEKAAEVNLAENTIRENMHPADQFEAFRNVIDQGKSVTDVAAAFGVTGEVVKRRMKLAQVSPAILQAYRDDKLTLEQVMAFAVTDDHEAQERVFGQHGATSPQYLRRLLTEHEVSARDPRVRYVTLKAYEKAGGPLKRDLFSDEENGTFIGDVALLDRLVQEKLDRAARPVQKEGWKWVETRVQFAYADKGEFQQVRAEPAPLPAKLAKEVKKLQAEYDKLVDDEQADTDRLDEIDARLEEIEESRTADFTAEQLAIAGAVVTIDNGGKSDIVRGLVRPDDMPKAKGKKGKSQDAQPQDGDTDAEDDTAGLSAALIESLTAHRSAALQAKLLECPNVALAAVVFTMVSDVFRQNSGSALRLAASSQSLHRVEGSPAFRKVESERETWGNKIPGDRDALWEWCLEQPKNVLLDLLTFCAAVSINTVVHKQRDTATPDALRHAETLAKAIKLDMTAWFTPTADNYFSKVAKPLILGAIQEAKGQPPAPAWEKLKKADLAREAERQIAGTGWLPELLR